MPQSSNIVSRIKLAGLFLLLFSITVFAGQDIFDDIAGAIRSGDARAITKFFGNNVDLTILSQEEMYSKAQAEQLLKDFFSKNTPSTFTIIHKGVSKEGSKYAIGNLVTSQGITYRTYFYIKQSGGNSIIQELRFMNE